MKILNITIVYSRNWLAAYSYGKLHTYHADDIDWVSFLRNNVAHVSAVYWYGEDTALPFTHLSHYGDKLEERKT